MISNDVFATFRSMELLLYISIVWLFFTSLILIRNLFDFKSLNSVLSPSKENKNVPLVSICIPARNEERVIDRCVTSALKQNYPRFEVLILDDNSTDDTTRIMEKLSGIITNLYHFKGKPKPHDWLGKSWACHQLSQKATGEYLVFIDADVWLEADAISKTVEALQEHDAITVWPKQYVHSFWEQMIIPLIYHTLFTLLPAKYVERKPKWMPEFLHKKFSPEFTAACGQFLAFKTEAYKKTGGHEMVKDRVLEDVELAKILRQSGYSLKMYHGVNTVNCRMYNSHHEVWNGLRKNFFAGFNKNIFLFTGMAFLHLLVFVMPVVFLLYALLTTNYTLSVLALLPLLLTFLQRILLDIRFGWNPSVSLLHPLSVLWFQVLGITCLMDFLRGKKVFWKGREL